MHRHYAQQLAMSKQVTSYEVISTHYVLYNRLIFSPYDYLKVSYGQHQRHIMRLLLLRLLQTNACFATWYEDRRHY